MLMRRREPESEIERLVSARLPELTTLAQLAAKKFENPVVFIFDSESLWTKAALQLAMVTKMPVALFARGQSERYVTGYCSWELCQLAALQTPEINAELLSKPEEGRVKLIVYHSDQKVGYITGADIPLHPCQPL